ncbi:ABC transporter permease [Enterococcus sp. LJL128]|uniref:ABC transporter permease n=1 Tax=Enterococcus sp. LJL51 TaxID=3416656 RepID=UPI003CF163BC
MKKYLEIFKIEWKHSLIYRSDVGLTAVLSIFSILLSYLLWQTIFNGRETFNGSTLAQMVTYYLFVNLMTPFTNTDGLLNTFAEEIRQGTYSKYLVRPISPLTYFITASYAQALFPFLITGSVLLTVFFSLNQYFEPIQLQNLLLALPVLLLGSLLNILISYIISLAAFKLTAISFLSVLQSTIKTFLSGSLIPLSLILPAVLIKWLPFSYTLYYPAALCLGKNEEPYSSVLFVLILWIALLYCTARFLQHKVQHNFEGVGI